MKMLGRFNTIYYNNNYYSMIINNMYARSFGV